MNNVQNNVHIFVRSDGTVVHRPHWMTLGEIHDACFIAMDLHPENCVLDPESNVFVWKDREGTVGVHMTMREAAARAEILSKMFRRERNPCTTNAPACSAIHLRLKVE